MSNIAGTLFSLRLKGNVAYGKDDIGGQCGLRVTRLDHPEFGVWEETDEMCAVIVGS